MKVISNTKTGANTVELEISVGAEQFRAAVDKAYHKNVGKINLPGFRKGKAPKAMIEKMYGKGFFYEDAVNSLYPEAYRAALEETALEPVDQADIEVLDVDDDGFKFKATVTTKPEVEVKDYKGIKAVKKVVKASDEDVTAELGRLQERGSRMVTVEGRAAQDGDTATIDFEGFVDDVAFPGGKGEGYPLVLGSGSFIPGFEEQIVGKEVGSEFDVNVTFPENYQAAELASKAAVFKCKLHELKNKELPELDDEFAKDVSEFDTLEELKADLRAKLQEHKDAESQGNLENDLVSEVIKNMTAEIPEVMFERRIDEMVQDFEYRLQGQGLNLDTYLQYTNGELASFRKTFREQAERQVKVRLALEKIAQLENLAATDEEVEGEYVKMASAYGLEADKMKSFVPAADVAKDIVVNKAIDLVRTSADVTEE